MSELDDLEIYVVPGIERGTNRPQSASRLNRRLTDAEADAIFERVKAEIAAAKAKAGDRK